MRILKRTLVLLLVLALLAGIGTGLWYFFLRDGRTFVALAKRFEAGENYDWALRCYEWAWDREPENAAMPLALADCYARSGNNTRCEATLWDAIERMPGETELYFALSRVYVSQNKLLDAAHLDEQIRHPEALAAFNAARPAAPVIQPEAGEYDEDCTVSLSYSSGTAYWTLTGDYPSMDTDAYTAPVRLVGQEATVVALVVDANGLVSPVATADYVVGFVNEPVTITDPALDALLRQSMGWVDGVELTTNMLATVESLTLTAEVQDLSQLSLLVHLKTLDAGALTRSADWTVLAGLKELETLILPPLTVDNHSLETIGTLTKLRCLDLSGCGLTTIAPLANLTALETLDISGGSVGDCSPLANLIWLRSLRLGGNAVTDVTALTGLTALEELELQENPLSSLAPLRSLLKLKKLNIDGTGAGNLQMLDGMTGLEELHAADNHISDAAPLAKLQKLIVLDLSHNELTDIGALANLTALVELDVSYNQLTTLPDFAGESVLTFLNASHNQLTDVAGLADLPRLNYVYVDYNEITDLLPLTSCTVLVQVDAFENPTRVAQELIDMGVIVHYTPVFDEETGEELTVDGERTADGETDAESDESTDEETEE